MPRQQIIFGDDFSENAVDSFPAKWHNQPCNSKEYTNDEFCRVAMRTGQKAMLIKDDRHTNEGLIDPRMKERKYLPDSFTLQLDFLMGTSTTMPKILFSNGGCLLEQVTLTVDDEDLWKIEASGKGSQTYQAIIRPAVDHTVWHNLAVSYYFGNLTCYLDGERVLRVRNCGYEARKFILSAEGDKDVAYTNVVVATGDYYKTVSYDFGLLLTEGRVVKPTMFDVNKAIPGSETTEYLRQLANWLRLHPSITLQVEGHTDNDGNAKDNFKLSLARADEIKRVLVSFGVAAERLTTAGFGDVRPMASNATAEGKAENRRVEFVTQTQH